MTNRWPELALPAPTADLPSVPLSCLQAGWERRPEELPCLGQQDSERPARSAGRGGPNPSIQASEPPHFLPSPGTKGMSEIGDAVWVCVCVPSFSHPFDEGDQAVEMGAENFQLHPLPGLEPQASSWGADVWGLGTSWPSKGGQIHQSPCSRREAGEPLRAQGRQEKRSLVPVS